MGIYGDFGRQAFGPKAWNNPTKWICTLRTFFGQTMLINKNRLTTSWMIIITKSIIKNCVRGGGLMTLQEGCPTTAVPAVQLTKICFTSA